MLLLGLLTTQDRHGYEINEFIERQLHCVTNLKKATAYQLLDRLEQHGLIGSRLEQHGQRPSRKVYTLTPAGHTHFLELLAAQAQYVSPLMLAGNVPIMFWEHLSPTGRDKALRERLAALSNYLASVEHVLTFPDLSVGVRLAAQRVQAAIRADLAWTQELLDSEGSAAAGAEAQL